MKNQGELFDYSLKQNLARTAPLAARMRPSSLDGFIGQKKTVGQGTALRNAIKNDMAGSIILWGPPGCGKTTLARIIARESKAKFYPISAVASGVADLRKIVAEAKELRATSSIKTILFIDEIHRFNKAQQDAILPFVENGLITLIGATTENPSFEVNNALLSRCRVYVMEPLSQEEMTLTIKRAIENREKGLAAYNPIIDKEAEDFLISTARGDARIALNALEYAVLSTTPNADGVRYVTIETMREALAYRTSDYDKKGENHYDIISAFIKSMRNSDPNAASYWLARMLEGGEEPLFIARRMIIFASEDIGLADPNALPLAVNIFQGVHSIGMPEGRILLAHGACYLALAKKNNSAYMALEAAVKDVKEGKLFPPPKHLRNAPTQLMKEQGYGLGYKYAHNYENGITDMQCLPDQLKDKVYFKSGKL